MKENIANKSTAIDLGGTSPSDELYPSQKAVKAYVTSNNASGGIADGSITTIKLADGAVTNSKIASGISKAKVGLENVENVSISTWSGTPSLTTVGTINSGTWSGTGIDVAHGGTGANTASSARTNLGLVIGTHVQAPLVAGTDYLTPTGSAIGSGLTNTNELIARLGNTTNHAAGLARSYRGGGFTDWYLPSLAELIGIRLNFDQTNNSVIGDMSYAISPDSDYGYWTSTYDSSTSFVSSVLWSILRGQIYLDFGNELYFVRPIRNFKVAK